jgi:hypothetical protein
MFDLNYNNLKFSNNRCEMNWSHEKRRNIPEIDETLKKSMKAIK